MISCDGVIFDFDGTVAFTAEDVWRAVDYAAEKAGGSIDPEYRSDPVNLSKPAAQIFRDNFGPLTDEQVAEMCRDLSHHYGWITDYPETYMYDGMEEVLAELRHRGIPAGIVTNKGERSLRRILEIKGWSGYFSYLLGSDSLGGLKKPELIAHMMASDYRSKNCIYIGDSFSDVTASRQNGIPCIAVTYGDGNTEDLIKAKPRYVCGSPREVYRILFE